LRDSLLGWLRGFFSGIRGTDSTFDAQSKDIGIDVGNGELSSFNQDATQNRPRDVTSGPGEAQSYLRRVRAKLDRLAEDFNKGSINRQQHVARAEGYAIFENSSGMPVSTLGRFELDPALLVPMLSSYRAATKEIFGSGTRSTEIEDGRWLCFVPGTFTTMLSVFSNEPAAKQLAYLEELHRHFEQANHRHLAEPPLNASDLIFPHQYFLGEWRRQ
jgi:hypothetical protein